MESEITTIMVNAGASLLTLLVSWGLAELSRYVRSKTQNERALAAMDHLDEVVSATVKEIEQEIRKAYADGKLTNDEKQRLKSLAMTRVNQQVPDAMKKAANLVVKSFDDFVSTKIEEAVYDQKLTRIAVKRGNISP